MGAREELRTGIWFGNEENNLRGSAYLLLGHTVHSQQGLSKQINLSKAKLDKESLLFPVVTIVFVVNESCVSSLKVLPPVVVHILEPVSPVFFRHVFPDREVLA